MGEKREGFFRRALRTWFRTAAEPCSNRRREEGLAILIVVLLTFIVSALGATMMVMSNTNHMIAANERDSERALFASKAGLEYGYHLFTQGSTPSGATPASFDSFLPQVSRPLDGASFTGSISYVSASRSLGQVFRILSTGVYNKASRTTETVLQLVPDPFRFGFLAFNNVALHNHSHVSGNTFKIDSTIFTNGNVEIQPDLTVDGTIVAGGEVTILNRSVLKKDLFANKVTNWSGAVQGNVTTLAVVDPLPDGATPYNVTDSHGKRYNWYNGRSSAGEIRGPGTVGGTRTQHTVRNGDEFKYSIFRADGKPLTDPDLNVIEYIPPPELDYQGMKREADKYEPTYFTSMAAAMSYLAGKRVTETIGGKTVTTIRVGTDTFPEFLYIVGDFRIILDPTLPSDNFAAGKLKADGFSLEGGIYATGDMSFNGPAYDPTLHPAPPEWYQFRINALPYCYPALVAYRQPSSGSISTWSPADTPIMDGTGSDIAIWSNPPEDSCPLCNYESPRPDGFVFINGVTYSQRETHLDHRTAQSELIRFNGAELAYRIHSCDYMWFTYDPQVRCTGFLVSDGGSPQVVSYREIR